jgi:hypothetical protein
VWRRRHHSRGVLDCGDQVEHASASWVPRQCSRRTMRMISSEMLEDESYKAL